MTSTMRTIGEPILRMIPFNSSSMESISSTLATTVETMEVVTIIQEAAAQAEVLSIVLITLDHVKLSIFCKNHSL
jgi:uncharacterized membrane protein